MSAAILTFPGTQILASRLAGGEFAVTRFEHGTGGFALDLSAESCVLCGGRFPPLGFAQSFYADSELRFIHEGCRSEVRAWAGVRVDDELPLPTPVAPRYGFACPRQMADAFVCPQTYHSATWDETLCAYVCPECPE